MELLKYFSACSNSIYSELLVICSFDLGPVFHVGGYPLISGDNWLTISD